MITVPGDFHAGCSNGILGASRRAASASSLHLPVRDELAFRADRRRAHRDAARRIWRRLIINLPPRHLKSHLASVAFPAWCLGHRPSAQILCVIPGL
jgi:hypothetical protein